MDLRRIYPDPASVTVREAAAAFRRDAEPHDDRPYLALNFAATADGRITIGGRSGPIGNQADRELFHELRTQADAVMAGAGTVGAERYGRLIRDADGRRRREEAGLEAEPLAILVSASLSLEPDLPLLQDRDSRVTVLTASGRELEGVRAQVEYLRPEDAPVDPDEPGEHAARLALAPLMRILRERHGVGTILCEGGSVLASALLRERLVDELFLCVAPKLAAGTGPTIVTGPPLDPPAEMELLSVHEAGGDLFLRYRLPG
jgi:riboflavin-specific deaminase-like protein